MQKFIGFFKFEMNEIVFEWLNSWNGQYAVLDSIIRFAQTNIVKAVPFMLVFWGLWFWPKTSEERTQVRNSLTATLICTVPILGVTRAIQNYTPHSPRPIHTPNLEVNLFDGQSLETLDGWSSMPSDHASLFMGIAVALFVIHRTAGLFLILWAIFISSLPRVIMGLHWPYDILVGWLLGVVIAIIFIGPITKLVLRTGIVKFFEAREMIGYPLLFLATYEVAQMFATIRIIINKLLL